MLCAEKHGWDRDECVLIGAEIIEQMFNQSIRRERQPAAAYGFVKDRIKRELYLNKAYSAIDKTVATFDKCVACGEHILEPSQGTVLNGSKYHISCVKCSSCEKPLANLKAVHCPDGSLLCTPCNVKCAAVQRAKAAKAIALQKAKAAKENALQKDQAAAQKDNEKAQKDKAAARFAVQKEKAATAIRNTANANSVR